MFWKFLIMIVLGLFFIKFGMMVAVAPLLAGGLQLALLALLFLSAVFVYKALKK